MAKDGQGSNKTRAYEMMKHGPESHTDHVSWAHGQPPCVSRKAETTEVWRKPKQPVVIGYGVD